MFSWNVQNQNDPVADVGIDHVSTNVDEERHFPNLHSGQIISLRFGSSH